MLVTCYYNVSDDCEEVLNDLFGLSMKRVKKIKKLRGVIPALYIANGAGSGLVNTYRVQTWGTTQVRTGSSMKRQVTAWLCTNDNPAYTTYITYRCYKETSHCV